MTNTEPFGVLAGVKVVYAASALAGPFAAQLMAEHGAEVIWIERAGMPENMRSYGPRGLSVEIDRRNQRTISLDLPTEEGRAILLELLKDAAIFIESSKGGQFARWGLSDETLWNANPALVIVHISGFGLTGDPERISRPSYDPIAQAYGCMLQLNGFPDRPPISAQPYLADYLTGLFACSSALAAYIQAKRTGEGESVDIAQYEVLIRTGGSPLMAYLNEGTSPKREGARNKTYAGCGAYACKDGEYVYVTFVGNGVIRNGLPLLGDDVAGWPIPDKITAFRKDSDMGRALDLAMEAFCLERPAQEVDHLFNQVGVPCSVVYTYEMAEADPHYQSRQVFVEWEDVKGGRVRGSNVFPKFKRNPGRIERGAPSIGMDNEEILQSIGYSDEEIQGLYERGIITKNGSVIG
jgi:L-carnitine CoA-transferase